MCVLDTEREREKHNMNEKEKMQLKNSLRADTET